MRKKRKRKLTSEPLLGSAALFAAATGHAFDQTHVPTRPRTTMRCSLLLAALLAAALRPAAAVSVVSASSLTACVNDGQVG